MANLVIALCSFAWLCSLNSMRLDLSDPQIGVSTLRVLRTRSYSICSYFANEVARSNVNAKSEIIVTASPAVRLFGQISTSHEFSHE